jgi:hypothetical protein
MAIDTCPSDQQKRILILSYSFSGQTSGLLRQIQGALIQAGHLVSKEKITPCLPLKFPTSSVVSCLKMMLTTFLRLRVPIQDLSPVCHQKFDLIILAGPTWSYNPSGPILSLLDREGPALFQGQVVLPVISCRGYWRLHSYGLKRILKSCGAIVPNTIVFTHPHREPWRTIGVFLKIAGKSPERWPLLGRHYAHFGHSKAQQEEAARFGALLGQAITQGQPLCAINFATAVALGGE